MTVFRCQDNCAERYESNEHIHWISLSLYIFYFPNFFIPTVYVFNIYVHRSCSAAESSWTAVKSTHIIVLSELKTVRRKMTLPNTICSPLDWGCFIFSFIFTSVWTPHKFPCITVATWISYSSVWTVFLTLPPNSFKKHTQRKGFFVCFFF